MILFILLQLLKEKREKTGGVECLFKRTVDQEALFATRKR
jgi:hypothetical protein